MTEKANRLVSSLYKERRTLEAKFNDCERQIEAAIYLLQLKSIDRIIKELENPT